MAELEEIEVGGRTFRVLPMTLARHRELAPIREKMNEAAGRDTELLLDIEDQRESLRTLARTGEVDSKVVRKVNGEVRKLQARRDAIVDELTSLQLDCIRLMVAPAETPDGADAEVSAEWWAEHYDLRDLPEHFTGMGLVRPTNLIPD